MFRRLLYRSTSMDLRALGVARMGVALVCLCDLTIRGAFLFELYSDDGFLPRATLLGDVYTPSMFSLYMLTSAKWYLVLLLTCQWLAAACMGLGYRTRTSNVILWVLYVSLDARNPYILDSGDRLLVLTLLWGFFSGWHRCYAMDRGWRAVKSFRVCNLGTVGFCLQLLWVYGLSVYWKWVPVWLPEEGTALYYALNLDLFTRPMAKLLLPYPTLLYWLTLSTMAIEILGPLLILTGQKRLRNTGAVLLMALHLGIFAFMSIGVFPMVSFCFNLAFLGFSGFGKSGVDVRRRWTDGPAGIFILLVVWWNLGQLGFTRPQVVTNICASFQLDQYWNLFSPIPRTIDSWYVVKGTTASGREYDLWRGKTEVSWERPRHTTDILKTHRHRIWGTSLEVEGRSALRQSYLRSVARRYNARNADDPLVRIEFFVVRQLTKPDYEWDAPQPLSLEVIELDET